MSAGPGELDVSVVGSGPTVLFVHGSAVDRSTWSLQRVRLGGELRMLLYDRRGTNGAGGVSGRHPVSIAEHAEDAAALLRRYSSDQPAVVCGSSFGGVVVLELLRRHPALVRQAVLLEPPLGDTELPDPRFHGLLQRFDAIAAAEGGPRAGAYFLQQVLGEDAFVRIAGPYRRRAEERWEEIRRDAEALLSYAPGYDTLRAVKTPVLLLGGTRSDPRYARTLRALQGALGNATLEFLPSGHTIQAEAHRAFNARLLSLANGIG